MRNWFGYVELVMTMGMIWLLVVSWGSVGYIL